MKTLIQTIAIIALVFVVGINLFSFFADEEHGSADESFFAKVIDTLADELNPLRTPTPLNEFVKVYEFSLSGNDFRYFEEAGKAATKAGYRTEFASKWRNVEMIYNGIKYDVQMSLHGDLPNHYANQKKSFKIKSDKNAFVEKTRRFNFIIAEDRQFFGTMFAEELANRIGLVSSHYELGLVFFNGMGYGLYVVEERWDEDLMEKNGLPETIIISLSDNWVKDNTNPNIRLSHITPFDLEISNYDEIDSVFSAQIAGRLKQMLDAVKKDNQELFGTYFDVEQTARFEAWRTILGQDHDFEGDNLRLFYDTTKGKFGLVPRNEGGIGVLKSCAVEGKSVLGFVSRNPLVVERKLEILQGVDGDSLVAFYDELQVKYGAISILDNTTVMRSSKVGYYARRNQKNLVSNLKFLKECKAGGDFDE